jgi:hypothetical protein
MLKFSRNELSPVVHQRDWGLVRVPVCREDGHYTVYVADGYQRIYTDDTLPDELKSRFAMILARSNGKVLADDKLIQLTLFVNTDDQLDEIGWRASETFFCLVLPRKFLESLKGGTQNDPREQS